MKVVKFLNFITKMSDDRSFKNRYAEYSIESSKGILDVSSKQLTSEFKEKNRNHLLELFNVMERNRSSAIDWHDTSVYTGAAGYIYLYTHLAGVLKDEALNQKCIPLVEKSLRKLKGKRETFLCGDAGPLSLAAVVYSNMGDHDQTTACIHSLLKLKRKVLDRESGLPDELLYGRMGYLYALLHVQQRVPNHGIKEELIRDILVEVLESGKTLAARKSYKTPLLYEWHDKYYIGAAHGMVGILSMFLQLKDKLTQEELTTLVKPSVDWILSLCFMSGNLPSSIGSNSDRLVHWCHGAPGGVFLFAQAYKVFGDSKYLDQAKKCGQVIWSRGLLKKGYGLCHGTAGNAYALLYLYQTSGDTRYLYQASQFATWCWAYGQHGCGTPDRPMSLFEGMAGTIYFLADLMTPDEAKFPAFVI